MKIAREVNAADSLACFSAANVFRDHMRVMKCDLIDNQEHVLVGVSFQLQPHQRQPWASKTARLRGREGGWGGVLVTCSVQSVEMLLA